MMSPTVMMYREVFQTFIKGGLDESQAATATELLVETVAAEETFDDSGVVAHAEMAETAVETFFELDFSADEDLQQALLKFVQRELLVEEVKDCLCGALARLI